MNYLFEIAAAGIGFLLLSFIVLFVCSIVLKWKMINKIFFGFMVFISSHLLLFYLVIFDENISLPSIMKKYTFGIMDLLTKLIPN